MDAPGISSSYFGNFPVDWWPEGSEAVVSAEAVAITAVLEERRRRLVHHIEEELERVGSIDDIPSAQRASYKRLLWESLVVVSDSTMSRRLLLPRKGHDANLDEPVSNEWLDERLIFLQGFVHELLSPYTESSGGSRPSADKTAQTTVCKWYGNKCALTGANRTEGAHIVPMRVTRSEGLQRTWRALKLLWPVERVDDLAYRGREPNNILPLARGIHNRWDAYQYYLRPILDHNAPDRRIYLQIIWADELMVGDPQGDAVLVEAANGRRPLVDHAAYPPLQTGDVLCLKTTNPALFPLPKLEFLQIQQGVHRILGGLRAAATLADIFRGGPPEDDDDDGAVGVDAGWHALKEDQDLPHIWRVLLEAAMDAGIMGLRDAGCWARAFVRHALDKRRALLGEEEAADED